MGLTPQQGQRQKGRNNTVWYSLQPAPSQTDRPWNYLWGAEGWPGATLMCLPQ